MKKYIFWFVCLCMIFYASSGYSSWLGNVEAESPAIWGVDNVNENDFTPYKGGIKVCKAEGKIIVGFYLTDRNMNFYRQTFPDGQRKSMGFELDVVDASGVFTRDDLIGVPEPSFSENVIHEDNHLGDPSGIYSVCINDPTQLEPNVWHTVVFRFSRYLDVNVAAFRVNVQLIGDIRKLRDEYNSLYFQYGAIVLTEFAGWFSVADDNDGSNFFGIRPAREMFYAEHFFDWPEGITTGYDRFLWHIKEDLWGDYAPYSCWFGLDPWDNLGIGGNNLPTDCSTADCEAIRSNIRNYILSN